MGYLTNFIVYTLAMVGVIILALMVFKGATNGTVKGGSKFLKIQDSLSIGPRKTLYIISAGEEKFLIAGDVDKTTLISKLQSNENTEIKTHQVENFRETIEKLPIKNSYIDRSIVGNYKQDSKPYSSVMKNLAERIRQ